MVRGKNLILIAWLISLIVSGWFGYENHKYKEIALDSMTYETSMTVADLNGIATLISAPKDWDGVSNATNLHELLVELEVTARNSQGTRLLTNGTPYEVGLKLNDVWVMARQKYIPVSRRILESKGEPSSKDKQAINQLVSDLKEAGFPVPQLRDYGWENYNKSLDKLLNAQNKHGGIYELP